MSAGQVAVSSGSQPTEVDGSRATSDPYSLSREREPDRRDQLAKAKQAKPPKSASAPAPPAPVRTKQEEPDKDKKEADPTESVEHEAPTHRRRHKESRSKAEDDDDDYEDDDDDSDDILPEAQPAYPRNQVEMSKARFRQNALHVYGLDFLRTGHMDEIFSQFDHKFVEWINDSAANIIFGDPQNAKKALESLSFPKVGDEPWRRTPDILVSEDVPPIFLQMRLATSTDAKRVKKAMPKVLPFDDAGPKGKSRGKGGRRANPDGPADGAKDGLGTKRPRAPLTPEELAARQKRAQRFKDWLVTTAPVEKTRDISPRKVSGRKIQQVMETTEEELTKRRRRLDRFADDDKEDNAAEQPPATAQAAEPESKDKDPLAVVASENVAAGDAAEADAVAAAAAGDAAEAAAAAADAPAAANAPAAGGGGGAEAETDAPAAANADATPAA